MTIAATKLTDNSFNIIVKANGVGSEDEQTLVDVLESNNASSEPKVSIADIHYEILGTGTGTIFYKNDDFFHFSAKFLLLIFFCQSFLKSWQKKI